MVGTGSLYPLSLHCGKCPSQMRITASTSPVYKQQGKWRWTKAKIWRRVLHQLAWTMWQFPYKQGERLLSFRCHPPAVTAECEACVHIPMLFSCISQASTETLLGNRSHGLQCVTNAVSAAVLTGPDAGRSGRVTLCPRETWCCCYQLWLWRGGRHPLSVPEVYDCPM